MSNIHDMRAALEEGKKILIDAGFSEQQLMEMDEAIPLVERIASIAIEGARKIGKDIAIPEL
jgi:hypothetical protein